MNIPDELYDILKWVCLIFLPAFSTAYSALAGIWGLPGAEQIHATVTVISLFLGTLLGVSSAEYNRVNSKGADSNEHH
ncbi:MAG: hypothetical protein IJT94_06355 [Oscillibacter sp.]|nr:hypothetical protein [Oscillibacter sp.]